MFENGDDIKRVNVFIPAAGLGERLRPITEHIPKPLVPVVGKPILQYVLDKVSALPLNKIGINLYHKKEMVEEWINRGIGASLRERIAVFREETVLGTGGALKNAEGLLRECTFLVHNSDILSDIDLKKLLKRHFSSGNLATLTVHDCSRFNNVIIDVEGFFKEIGREFQEGRRVAFTGIAVYEPAFLDYLPPGQSGVVEAWLKAVASGNKIGTYDVTGCYWSDIGSHGDYAAAVFEKMRREGEVVFFHPSVKPCRDINFQGNVVIEDGCLIEDGISLKNCILLPGCRVPPHPPLDKGGLRGGDVELPLQTNCIIGPGFKIDLNEREILPFVDEGKQLIGTGGSDRKYYRIREGSDTVVLMKCREDDQDFERHIEFSRFFLRHRVPVPLMMNAAYDKKEALFEDAGDISLYSWLLCPRAGNQIEEVYRKVIDALMMIHTAATSHLSECHLLEDRIFDYDHFRWETDYFIERFVRGILKIETKDNENLKDELHKLALKADSFPRTVIHRDFQSQNIVVMNRSHIRVIDFQGARIGPPAYDMASFLWDPYYRLEDELRERLLNYYVTKREKGIIPPCPPLKKGGMNIEGKFDEETLRQSLVVCRLQRHMQALGAYGFLSSVKGKRYFLKHVPEGLRLLKEDISLASDEYPELYKLIMRL